jgi:hypothetical protein
MDYLDPMDPEYAVKDAKRTMAKEEPSARRSAAACSPLARQMLDAAKNRKGDTYGDAASRVIAVADQGRNLYDIAHWNNVVDVLRELSKFTENETSPDAGATE